MVTAYGPTRERRSAPPVPAFGDSLRADELASLSLNGYVQKPYTQRELASGLRHALDDARRA
jgi:hypothetical protein